MAVGIATALRSRGPDPASGLRAWPVGPSVGRAGGDGVTIAAFGGVNVAMGQGLLPNSVLAKGVPGRSARRWCRRRWPGS